LEEKELQMLIDLTDARGVPGNEGEVREVFRRYAEPFAESFSQDGLGGLFAKHTGAEEGPTILLAGHLDEVGIHGHKYHREGIRQIPNIRWMVESGHAGPTSGNHQL
jgi:putative aminopeptidase FrvX